MWKLAETVVGFQRYVVTLMVYEGPVKSGQILIRDWKSDDNGPVSLTTGDFQNVKILFDQLREACEQKDTRGWTVMKTVYNSAVAVAEKRTNEVDIDDHLAAEVESQIENYGAF